LTSISNADETPFNHVNETKILDPEDDNEEMNLESDTVLPQIETPSSDEDHVDSSVS